MSRRRSCASRSTCREARLLAVRDRHARGAARAVAAQQRGGTTRRRCSSAARLREHLRGADQPQGARALVASRTRRRSYLTASAGPRADIASYTGSAPRDLAPILATMRLRRFRCAGGDELLDVMRAPLPDPTGLVPGPVPADLGRDAARPRAPRGDPARGAPVDDLSRAQSALHADVSRRRRGGGDVEVRRRPDRPGAVRAAYAATRRELRAEADRLAAFHA